MAKLLFRALLMALSNEIGVCENPIPKIRKVNIFKIYLSFYLIYFFTTEVTEKLLEFTVFSVKFFVSLCLDL